MRALVASLGLWLCAQAALATPSVDRLADVLRLPEVMVILRAEGLEQRTALEEDFLGGRGGPGFAARISQIFDASRMTQTVSDALAQGLTEAEIEACLAFLDTALGRRLTALEISARQALSDPDIEAAALERLNATPPGDPVLLQVAAYVAVNDIVERNVAGIQNSDFAFYRGFAEASGLDRDDEGYLARLLEEAEALRSDTRDWAMSFHLMAYSPLSLSDLEANVTFSRSPAGQALNDALFDGFDAMYDDLYYRMGLAVAREMTAKEL